MLGLIGFIGIFAACAGTPPGVLAGNGDKRHIERQIAAFNHIDFTAYGDVFVHFGNEYRVDVTADSNIVPHIITKVYDNTLYIAFDLGSYRGLLNPSRLGLRFDVYTRNIESFFSGGEGSIRIIDIDTAALTLNHIGEGSFTVTGKAMQFVVYMIGEGNIKAENFAVERASVNIIGATGRVKVWAEEFLEASVNPFGSGSIKYRGDPAVLIKNNTRRITKMRQ
jgi:hypothetical protein